VAVVPAPPPALAQGAAEPLALRLPFDGVTASPGLARAIQLSERGCKSSPKRVKGFCSTWGLAYPARPHDPKPFHENRLSGYHSPVRSSRSSLISRTCASRVAHAILYPLFSPCRAAPCCVAPAARVLSPHGDATTGARSLRPLASRRPRPVPPRCTRSLGA